MDTQELKKEVKHMQVNKNFIIIALSIALIIVSAIAIGEARRGRGYGTGVEGRQFKGNMMMRDGNRNGGFRDYNQNQLPPAPVGTSTNQ